MFEHQDVMTYIRAKNFKRQYILFYWPWGLLAQISYVCLYIHIFILSSIVFEENLKKFESFALSAYIFSGEKLIFFTKFSAPKWIGGPKDRLRNMQYFQWWNFIEKHTIFSFVKFCWKTYNIFSCENFETFLQNMQYF